MAKELQVIGLMNIQFAIQGETLYVLEVNPRASRTIPFVSKSIGVPLAKLAAKVMVGYSLQDLGFTQEIIPNHYSIKEAVFPFSRFPGVDILLGPEMKSTGEVMGIDKHLGIAYAKAQMAASPPLPTQGRVFISVRDEDKIGILPVARTLYQCGLSLIATQGTAHALQQAHIPCQQVFKLTEGRPNILDMLKNGDIQLIINTPAGQKAREDEIKIRTTALHAKVPVMTTLAAAQATAEAIEALKRIPIRIQALQDYHSKS
jgi:carbamoyl-phosphate synthase large subunit